MTRYVALAQATQAAWDDEQPLLEGRTVHVEDDSPVDTGLHGGTGTKLYRVRDRIKIGFCK